MNFRHDVAVHTFGGNLVGNPLSYFQPESSHNYELGNDSFESLLYVIFSSSLCYLSSFDLIKIALGFNT